MAEAAAAVAFGLTATVAVATFAAVRTAAFEVLARSD